MVWMSLKPLFFATVMVLTFACRTAAPRPDATHNYYVGRTGGDREFPALSRYVPGHFDMVVEWAAKRFGL